MKTDSRGLGRGAAGGTLGVPLEAPSVSANSCGLIKGVKYRFTLKDGTWDFPGDAVAGKGLIL